MLLALGSLVFAENRFVQATVEGGQLRIVTSDGRAILLPKEGEQVGFDQIAISPDGSAVGWVALHPFCCTSYPIPLKLLIYSGGEVRAFTGNGLPIWRWQFVGDGKRFVFKQETVRGGRNVHYELRDIGSGRLIAEYNPPVGPDNEPLANQRVPQWAAELDSNR